MKYTEIVAANAPGEDPNTFLNAALRDVTTEFVWIRCPEAVPAGPDTAQKLLAYFNDPAVSAVFSSQRANTGKTGISEAWQAAFFPAEGCTKEEKQILTGGMETFFLSNISCMYRTSDLRAVGGFAAKELSFSEHITGADLIHLGKKIVYAADAEVKYLHRLTPALALREGFDYGIMEKRNIQAFGLYVIDDGSYGVIGRSLVHIYRDAYRTARRELLRKGAALKVPGAWLCYLGLKYGNILGRRYHRLPRKLLRALCSDPKFFV